MLIVRVVCWEDKSSDFFEINQGVAQDCTLSPTLFLIYKIGPLCEIENAKIWCQILKK